MYSATYNNWWQGLSNDKSLIDYALVSVDLFHVISYTSLIICSLHNSSLSLKLNVHVSLSTLVC